MASAQQQFSPKLRRQTAGQGSSASQVILSPFWKNLARIEQNKQQAAGTPLTLHSPGFLRRKRSGKRNSLRRVPLTGFATGIGLTLRSFGFLGNGPLRRYAVHSNGALGPRRWGGEWNLEKNIPFSMFPFLGLAFSTMPCDGVWVGAAEVRLLRNTKWEPRNTMGEGKTEERMDEKSDKNIHSVNEGICGRDYTTT
ncbi:hypothetical protein GE21DRAFT_865 [Neurospora crassa]|uniref:Uncharacterized protein n=1 Tax=Neurospora crassa (strain ATCC 24698 / 74-OR23-1A / CBS 708.71 / DSM 1257 / FGSC 987) TaxID=367110 RepID=V5IPJ0_NEUCR|nr:hypothetical protein NCU16372 [Neurospora crassa OR74A]ESA43952.1 hypothetical protein NCU16372 [Neurospora crassa OR74A]KHE90119.1 hypothetical protein GE21DRAFT_865 [Neurospora crassa]|eukprot:XP_011393366.1 hypothetical protein NCU16372 [Neurospora crassa OR74A]